MNRWRLRGIVSPRKEGPKGRKGRGRTVTETTTVRFCKWGERGWSKEATRRPARCPKVSAGAVGAGPVQPTRSAIASLQPLGVGEVILAQDHELGDWQRRNSAMTLPHCIERVIAQGAVRNLERVALGRGGEVAHEGLVFSDSDIYKALEAIAWDSVRGHSAGAEDFVEEAAARHSRGPSAQTVTSTPGSRASTQNSCGKTCAGGMSFTAPATCSKRPPRRNGQAATQSLADVAEKLVEPPAGNVLPGGRGRPSRGRVRPPRGRNRLGGVLPADRRRTPAGAWPSARWIFGGGPTSHCRLPACWATAVSPCHTSCTTCPCASGRQATGHAVRELYLQAGVVDVAVETADLELLAASEAIWEDLFATKTYVTGAHGSRHRDESIGDAYELPSDRAYAETCAAIASFQWNWRLLLATGRARYAEEMERVFWNTIAGAVSREGTEFFYSNTLHLRTGHDGADEDSPRHRLPWYGCPCCPPNLARLMASIQAYLVTRDASGLQVHMPFSGTVSTEVPGGSVDLTVRTGHPWEGTTDYQRWHGAVRASVGTCRCACPNGRARRVRG